MPKTVRIGAIIIICLLVVACLAPVLTPVNPLAVNMGEKLQGLSRQHPMGTDQLGRDVLSRVLYGARTSMAASFSVVIICLAVGIAIGCIAGFYGGVIDELLMRLVDIMMAFPPFILPIAITGILGPSLTNIIIALALTSWVGYARMVRSSVLTLKHLDFVAAAKAMGSSRSRIIREHIVPNAVHPLVVYAAFNASHTILAISGLSFIGLGAQPPTPEWGNMLSEACSFMGSSPYLFIFPGLMIMLTVLAFNLLGDGLRDYLDPRLGTEVDL